MDEKARQYTPGMNDFAHFADEDGLQLTSTMTTTPSTLASADSHAQQSSGGRPRRSRTQPPAVWSPSLITSENSSFPGTPQKYATPDRTKRVHIDTDKDSSMGRTSTPQTASTQTTKKTESSADSRSIVEVNALGKQAHAPSVYRNLFACAPSLFQAAAACVADGQVYPDPEIAPLEESTGSNASEEAEMEMPNETSQQRRQRLLRNAEKTKENTDALISMQEDEGMELIFFQDDEEDWSQFPWSDRLLHTEKMDKDIFLSFAQMGFEESPQMPPKQVPNAPETVTTGRPTERLDRVPELRTVLSESDGQLALQTEKKEVTLARVSTAPPIGQARNPPPSASPQDTTNPPVPLGRTKHFSNSSRPQTSPLESLDLLDRPNAVVDRVSSIIKSVPNVFAKLAQTATGPSSESEILLSRSSSQVTWVSHDEDFILLDDRPVNEIVISSPLENGAGTTVQTIQAIRNVIFDSIERAESEHKEGEDGDLDAPLDPALSRYPVKEEPDPDPLILLSPSSLTDSQLGSDPPLSNARGRVPSDGDDRPRSPGVSSVEIPGSRSGAKEDEIKSTPPKTLISPVFSDLDEVSELGDNLFVDDSPIPPKIGIYQPQPDTPGERQSLIPPRSLSYSPSTFTDMDDDSVGLNALSSPDRVFLARKMAGDWMDLEHLQQPSLHVRTPSPLLGRVLSGDAADEEVLSPDWDYRGADQIMPTLTPSDDGSDSSSENIDHLLLDQRPNILNPGAPTLYDERSHGSLVDAFQVNTARDGTFDTYGDIESVVDAEVDMGTGLFSCVCWDIPPLIEDTHRTGMFRRRERGDGLLMDRIRSDDGSGTGVGGKKGGLGRKMRSLVRTTSNTFRDFWRRSPSRSQ